MPENRPGRITLIAEADPWSEECLTALQNGGLLPILQDPVTELFEDRVRDSLFVVPVEGFDSVRFDLVRQIGEFGGVSLVLAGSRETDVSMKCWTIKGATCVGQISLDFSKLVRTAVEFGTRQ